MRISLPYNTEEKRSAIYCDYVKLDVDNYGDAAKGRPSR